MTEIGILRFLANDGCLNTQVGMCKGRDIISTGQEGYLIYGQYLPLPSGRYQIRIHGQIKHVGTPPAYADIATQKGNKVLSSHAMGTSPDTELIAEIEVLLKADVTDFEVRVWVAADSELSISKLEILPESLFAQGSSNTLAWALITGTIRDETFLLNRLKFFSELKKLGHLEQIVFSTWKGEIENFPSINTAINNYGFILVESDPPDIVCLGHYIHQIVALKNGLEVCPDNQFILRTRTDKCGPEFGFTDEQIIVFLQNRNYARSCRDTFDIFNYRIGIFGCDTSVSKNAPILFFWNDRAYFGIKEDLQKFLNFNIMAFGYQGLIPEQALFAAPFLHTWPVFSFFFEGVNQKETVEKVLFNNEYPKEKNEALTTFLVANRLFRQAFLTEQYLLHKYFFDIPSGSNFEFNTKYRDIEIWSKQEMRDILSFANDGNIKRRNFLAEIESLALFLQVNFSINPVTTRTHEVGGFERYTFKTPPSNISITNRCDA